MTTAIVSRALLFGLVLGLSACAEGGVSGSPDTGTAGAGGPDATGPAGKSGAAGTGVDGGGGGAATQAPGPGPICDDWPDCPLGAGSGSLPVPHAEVTSPTCARTCGECYYPGDVLPTSGCKIPDGSGGSIYCGSYQAHRSAPVVDCGCVKAWVGPSYNGSTSFGLDDCSTGAPAR